MRRNTPQREVPTRYHLQRLSGSGTGRAGKSVNATAPYAWAAPATASRMPGSLLPKRNDALAESFSRLVIPKSFIAVPAQDFGLARLPFAIPLQSGADLLEAGGGHHLADACH